MKPVKASLHTVQDIAIYLFFKPQTTFILCLPAAKKTGGIRRLSVQHYCYSLKASFANVCGCFHSGVTLYLRLCTPGAQPRRCAHKSIISSLT